MRYWWAMLAGAVLGMSGCQWEQVTDRRTAYYPLQGISTYKGQSVAELWDDNGAPNIVKNMDDGAVMWVYYTNYRPAGGGEIISYDNPAGNGALPGGNGSIPGNGGYMANGNGSIPGSGAMTTAGSNMPAAGSTGTRAASLNSDGGDGLQRKHCGRRIYRGGTERFGRKQCRRKLQRQGHFAQRQGGGSLFRLQLILTVPLVCAGANFA